MGENPIAQYSQCIISRTRSPFQKWRLGRIKKPPNLDWISHLLSFNNKYLKAMWKMLNSCFSGKNALWLVAEGGGNTVFLATVVWSFYLVNLGAGWEGVVWFKYQMLLTFLPNLYIFFLNTCCFIWCFPLGKLPELLHGCFKIMFMSFTRE